jgi:hypothetical protein
LELAGFLKGRDRAVRLKVWLGVIRSNWSRDFEVQEEKIKKKYYSMQRLNI